ncbi:unnamed protein product [Acanthoscelides obtectus]|uniref:DDE Tnp4 domain-containing protein n=1 Tax=Acanthoscelides obtectus TaxID=200917 RepID=A0A9P0K063_ACAOB|nr:unnamed protein product [Acanthoscelides obtectus]CAK1639009.1 Protein ALP1-like [Acanthoscelides obtectus]
MAAKQFKIDKSALSRRRTRSLGKQGRKTSLTKEMEVDLSDKIKIMAKWGFALTKPEIQAIVQTYVQENHLTAQFKEGKPESCEKVIIAVDKYFEELSENHFRRKCIEHEGDYIAEQRSVTFKETYILQPPRETRTMLVAKQVKFPKTSEEWQEIAYNIETRWNFPNCGGSIDGKHLRIVKPANSGSYFFNYKDYHSIVLMALVNADYEFIYVNVGCNGRVSDGGVLEYTKFYDKLIEKKLNLPSNDVTKHNLNFVFVADDAFALHENILKPFPGNNLTKEESIFNYRLSRVRRTVENAFGILANRFRVFHTPINMQPDKIDKIVLAACALHNFLRRSKTSYITRNDVDTEIIDTGDIIRGDWRAERPLDNLQPGYGRNASREAKENRLHLESGRHNTASLKGVDSRKKGREIDEYLTTSKVSDVNDMNVPIKVEDEVGLQGFGVPIQMNQFQIGLGVGVNRVSRRKQCGCDRRKAIVMCVLTRYRSVDDDYYIHEYLAGMWKSIAYARFDTLDASCEWIRGMSRRSSDEYAPTKYLQGAFASDIGEINCLPPLQSQAFSSCVHYEAQATFSSEWAPDLRLSTRNKLLVIWVSSTDRYAEFFSRILFHTLI